MSRIGKLPIKIPEGVKIEIEGDKIKALGPRGSLEKKLPSGIVMEKSDDELRLTSQMEGKKAMSIYGTTRSLIANMVRGVADGWSKTLEMVGTGYRAETVGETLSLSVGYSQPVKVIAPPGITFTVVKTDITVGGVDREIVGLIAAKIRKIRIPEPYKGKGIKYKDEIIRRKAGKAARVAGAPA